MDTNNQNDGDIIFEFFKKLTNNDLQPKDRQQPFNLYFGAERRRKILDAIMLEPSSKLKAAGEQILTNYRGSLEKCLEREKRAIQEMKEKGQDYADDDLDMRRFMEKRITEWEKAKQPDPRDLEMLISDLNWRSKVEILDSKSNRDLKAMFGMK